MSKKEFVVFGLGKFGSSVARTLSTMGCNVIAVDKSEERIQEIANDVTYAVSADVTDQEVLENLGIGNLDVAIVAISNDMEASVMATILARELGVPYIVAKASTDIHKKILVKVGADKVVFPEKEMGARMARNLVGGNFVDLVELSSDFSIAELNVRHDWMGKSIREIKVRERYGVNIIAVKEEGVMNVSPDPDMPLKESNQLILIGKNADLNKLDGKIQ